MHVPADKCHKLDEKSLVTVLVGFEPGSKGYKLWDHQTHTVKLSRDVTFDESSFPSCKDSTVKAGPPQPAIILTPTAPVTAPDPSTLPPVHTILYEQPPSLSNSTGSDDEVNDLLDRPTTPPSTVLPTIVYYRHLLNPSTLQAKGLSPSMSYWVVHV